ncbi:hypothetical protein ACIGFK_21230 [Streptomyces sp. NPDC085524]|uniref:hypothetical protein n=1 Tax=Streptomyces sp. NPDC085524 TaxID=3365728 RepID=UPI0037D546A2
MRTAAAVLVVGAVALLPLLTGCGDTGGLAGAGATPTARGPVHLWPERQGATVPPADPGGAPPEYVKGIPPVKDQDVHAVDPVALVQAELRAHPNTDVGPDGMPPKTAAAILACREDAEGAEDGDDGDDRDEDPGGAGCPVMKPYYRDLTGDGKDELIIGIEFGTGPETPEKEMSVRVYTADPAGRLNRIMATTQSVITVELAGQDVILRAPSGNNGYELITAWSWDEKQLTMLPTREQIVRVPANPQAPAKPSGSRQPSRTKGPGGGPGGGPGTGSGGGTGPGTGRGGGGGVGRPGVGTGSL